MCMIRFTKITLILLLVFVQTATASAAVVSIRPFLIDETVEPRDIVTRDITVTSEVIDRNLNVYATVNEISLNTEGEILDFVSPVMTDRTNTVTSWVEISRGRILLEPGQSTVVPLTLRIHPYAEPGEYHVFIGFVAAQNRPTAESIVKNGDADGVIVKVVVDDTTSESLHITDFDVNRFVFNEEGRSVAVEVENIGDAPSTPDGEIIFYNARGEEVGAVDVNKEGNVIGPEETTVFNVQIPFSDKLGRFKANLTLQYGEDNASSVFDTTQFYMLSYRILALLFLGIVILSVVITLLLRRLFDDEDFFDEDGIHLPLHFKTGKEYEEKDHDISLK